jgi:hypothetical protein
MIQTAEHSDAWPGSIVATASRPGATSRHRGVPRGRRGTSIDRGLGAAAFLVAAFALAAAACGGCRAGPAAAPSNPHMRREWIRAMLTIPTDGDADYYARCCTPAEQIAGAGEETTTVARPQRRVITQP